MDFGKGSVVEWGLQTQGIDTKKYKREAGQKIADNPIKSGAMIGGGLVGGFGALLGVDGGRNKNFNTVYNDKIMKMEAKQDKLLNADVGIDKLMKNHDKSHELFKKTMNLRNNPEKLLKSPKYNLLQTKSALKGAVPMAALGAGLGAVYGDTTNKAVQEFKHATTESFGLIKIASTNYNERMIENKIRRTGCSREEAERTMDIADSQYLSEVFMDDFVNKLTGGTKK